MAIQLKRISHYAGFIELMVVTAMQIADGGMIVDYLLDDVKPGGRFVGCKAG